MQLLKLERMYLQVVVWDQYAELEPPHSSVLGVSRRYDEHRSTRTSRTRVRVSFCVVTCAAAVFVKQSRV
jgi:predicted molibdopterin-dependent oxidoreductase YjgC